MLQVILTFNNINFSNPEKLDVFHFFSFFSPNQSPNPTAFFSRKVPLEEDTLNDSFVVYRKIICPCQPPLCPSTAKFMAALPGRHWQSLMVQGGQGLERPRSPGYSAHQLSSTTSSDSERLSPICRNLLDGMSHMYLMVTSSSAI